MQYVFGGILITIGAILLGLAYHNTISQAWQELTTGKTTS